MNKPSAAANLLLYALIIGLGAALIWSVLPRNVSPDIEFPPSVVDVCDQGHPPVPCKGAFR